MGRYLLSALAGVLLASALAWSFRESVAYAEPHTPPHVDWVSESVRGCVDGMGLADVTMQGQVVRVSCRPNLGISPVKGGRR